MEQMEDEEQGVRELTVSSPEHVARRLSSKGEKSISVTRSNRGGEANSRLKFNQSHSLIQFLGICISHVIFFFFFFL